MTTTQSASKAGKARAASLTPDRRKEIARLGAFLTNARKQEIGQVIAKFNDWIDNGLFTGMLERLGQHEALRDLRALRTALKPRPIARGKRKATALLIGDKPQ